MNGPSHYQIAVRFKDDRVERCYNGTVEQFWKAVKEAGEDGIILFDGCIISRSSVASARPFY